MLLAHNTGDIFFFSINEFRIYDSTAENSFLSFALAIVMLTISIGFYALGFSLVYKAQQAKKDLLETCS